MLIDWPLLQQLLLMISFINAFIIKITTCGTLSISSNEIDGQSNDVNSNFKLNNSFNLLLDLCANKDETYSDFELIPDQRNDSLQIRLNIKSNNRQLKISESMTNQLLKETQQKKFQFEIVIILKQDKYNTGTILHVWSRKLNIKYLELQSNGRHDELRLYYLINNENSQTSVIPYHLADNQWHQIHLIFYGFYIQLFINCVLLYKNSIKSLNWDFTNDNLVEFWIGQRRYRNSLFKGAFQEFVINFDNGGMVPVCNQETLNELNLNTLTLQKLSDYVLHLSKRLINTEQKLNRLEQIQCINKTFCNFNGSRKYNNEIWNEKCNTCVCSNGEIQCKQIICDKNKKCKNPVYSRSNCCPICLQSCQYKTTIVEHGEKIEIDKCKICQCNNGQISKCNISEFDEKHSLSSVICQLLTCPQSQQIISPVTCCKTCLTHDFCSLMPEKNCHKFATCHNLYDRFICECNDGYFGNGSLCEDIDECLQTNYAMFGHNCDLLRSKCINTNGSYVCQCLDGFQNIDNFTCVDINECKTGTHKCHVHAKCINLIGTYRCECNDHFYGNGFQCDETYNKTCLNGGICTNSNECLCRKGFHGVLCENDIDECAFKLHHCNLSSDCINMPGWYYCKCKAGYHAKFLKNSFDLQVICEDIDECKSMTHTCGSNSECVNTIGSFRCECANCMKINCVYQGEIIEDDQIVHWPNLNGEMVELINTLTSSSCKKCYCKSGVITCNTYLCNCTNNILTETNTYENYCCPECNQQNHTCIYQNTIYNHGQKWLSKCETCQCRFGKIDCQSIDCPPIHCNQPIFQNGDCCPRCDHDFCFSLDGICAFSAKFFDSGVEMIESAQIISNHAATQWYIIKWIMPLIIYSAIEMIR